MNEPLLDTRTAASAPTTPSTPSQAPPSSPAQPNSASNAPPLDVTPPRRRRWGALALGVVAAAAAAALLLRRPDHNDGAPRSTAVSGELDVFVKRAGKVFRWQTQALEPGDQLRYSFRAPEPLQVMVLSREAGGAVHQYFPAGPNSFAVDTGVTLSKLTTELAATSGGETIWAVFCQQPFTAPPLLSQLESNGAVTPADGCATQRFEVTKGARRE